MIARALLGAALLAATSVSAGPDRLSIMIGSQHINPSHAFSEINPGIFATWENRALGLDYTAGAYRNSYGRGSVALTAALPVIKWPDGQIAVFAGLGLYPKDGRTFRVHAGDVVPLGGIQIRQGNAFAQIMPGDGNAADAVVTFGATFSLRGLK